MLFLPWLKFFFLPWLRLFLPWLRIFLPCLSSCSTTTEGSRDDLTSARCCNYSYMCSWWWVELPPETCRASSLQKYNKPYIVASRWTIIHIVTQIRMT
jgi:hypothetical protein